MTAARLLPTAAGAGGAGAAIAAAEHAALQAEVDGGLAACVHLLHGIDLPWRPSTPWGAPVEVEPKTLPPTLRCCTKSDIELPVEFCSQPATYTAGQRRAICTHLLLCNSGPVAWVLAIDTMGQQR